MLSDDLLRTIPDAYWRNAADSGLTDEQRGQWRSIILSTAVAAAYQDAVRLSTAVAAAYQDAVREGWASDPGRCRVFIRRLDGERRCVYGTGHDGPHDFDSLDDVPLYPRPMSVVHAERARAADPERTP